MFLIVIPRAGAIHPPEFLSVAFLTKTIANEKANTEFDPLEYYHYEIAQLLLTVAKDDIPDADQVI